MATMTSLPFRQIPFGRVRLRVSSSPNSIWWQSVPSFFQFVLSEMNGKFIQVHGMSGPLFSHRVVRQLSRVLHMDARGHMHRQLPYL